MTQHDVIIIGGGIAGISAAARLAKDFDTMVLEAEPTLGYHATGRSAAIFLKDYGNDVVRALNYASIDDLTDAQLLTPRDMLLLAKPDQQAVFAQEYPSFGLEEISVAQAQAQFPILNPNSVGFAAYGSNIHDLDADLMLQGFAKQARHRGAQITTSAPVDMLTKTAHGWRVEVGPQTFTCRHIVNAAGAWADHIATLAGVAPLRIQPYRRSFAQLAAPSGYDMTGWPLVDGVGESWYAKPSAGKILVSPADEDPLAACDAYADDMVLAEGLARYGEMVTPPITRPEATWAGLRSFAPDRALVIGPDPAMPDFLWCAGQGGYGFQTAPAASQLLHDIMTSRPAQLTPATIAALSPARLRPADNHHIPVVSV